MEVSLLRVFLSLAVVIGLIGLCALMLKWLSEKTNIIRQLGSNKKLKMLESVTLDQKHKLFLVAYDKKEFAIISGNGNITVLNSGEYSPPSDTEIPAPPVISKEAHEA